MSPGRISSALDGSKPSRSHPSSPQSAAPEPKRPPSNLVFYAPAPNLYQLMALIHTLPSYLEANPKVWFSHRLCVQYAGTDSSFGIYRSDLFSFLLCLLSFSLPRRLMSRANRDPQSWKPSNKTLRKSVCKMASPYVCFTVVRPSEFN